VEERVTMPTPVWSIARFRFVFFFLSPSDCADSASRGGAPNVVVASPVVLDREDERFRRFSGVPWFSCSFDESVFPGFLASFFVFFFFVVVFFLPSFLGVDGDLDCLSLPVGSSVSGRDCVAPSDVVGSSFSPCW